MAHVLIIEDNPTNLELMAYLLSAFGHTPLAAHDGVAGLEAARREAPDLIVCDMQLPRLDGYEVARCQAYTDASSTLLPSRWTLCHNGATRVRIHAGMQPRLACDQHYRAEPVTWDYIELFDLERLPLKRRCMGLASVSCS